MVSSTRSDVAGIGESDALNAGLSGDERRTLARALDFAASVYGEKPLGTGEPAYGHAIGLARNVAELRLDADARVAGLLFSVPEYLSDGEEKLAASFGAAVASLVAGISRLNSLRVITRTVAMGKDSQSQAEVLRKMLLAMVEDLRVVLLRLASRTQTLRWLSRGPEAGRRELARETLDIYAPLANRLGVWQLKWELEDLSFRYLEPELYQRIAGMLEDRRSERERSVEHAIAELADELARAGIRGEIAGRPKHLYSIYSKMRAKSLDFPEMHRDAELGVAAHWRYKEGAKRGKGDPFDEKIAWLRQMLAWRDEIVDASDWVEQSKRAVLDDTVYVLTPQGRVIDLPQGATPVDFAYALHTDIGHRCRGAKVNGAIAPLDYRLKNAESVEIITAKSGGPGRDWLNPALGYIKSARARNKVRQWFNSREIAGVVAAGRAAVERELQRGGKRAVSLEELAKRLGFGKPDELFAAVGREEVGPRQLRTALLGEAERPQPAEVQPKSSRAGRPRGGILVVGVERLLTQLARCCKPAPPDRISGFVTKGRGVSVHRRDCPSLARLVERFPERGIGAEWGGRAGQVYPVDIVVRGNDRQGLLRDVTETLARERTNVIAAKTQNRHNVASMHFTIEVEDIDQLRRALSAIEDVRGVFAAARR